MNYSIKIKLKSVSICETCDQSSKLLINIRLLTSLSSMNNLININFTRCMDKVHIGEIKITFYLI